MGRTIRGRSCRQTINYAPLPSQAAFHKSNARFKGFSGAIGSGKSAALCHEVIKLAYVNPGRVGLLGAPTYPMLRDATLTALIETLASNEIPYALNRSDMVLTFRDTSSKVLLRSLDEYERLRGTNLAWFGVDELTYTHEQAWLRLEGRLRDPKARRHCGFGVWTPRGLDWVYRRFIACDDDSYHVIRATPGENKHLLAASPDFYERLRKTYDEGFYRQEVLGEYIERTEGRVYKEFEAKVHLKKLVADHRYPLLWALDFNVNPLCSVVAQVIGDEVLVLDEIVLNRAKTTDACAEFFKRHGSHTAGLTIYGDASGKAQRTTGNSDFEQIDSFFKRTPLRNARIEVPSQNPTVRDRTSLVNTKLRNGVGEIAMYIDPRCTELIKDLEQVQYKGDTNDIDKERDPKRTHLSDALGYLVWQTSRRDNRIGPRPHPLT